MQHVNEGGVGEPGNAGVTDAAGAAGKTVAAAKTVAVLIAGYRFAGKSLVLQHLEQAGYTCVDNLPAGLLPEYLAHAERRGRGGSARRLAIVVDADTAGGDADTAGGDEAPRAAASALVAEAKTDLEASGGTCRIVFMYAGETALQERYAAARDAAEDAVARRDAERAALEPLKAIADLVIDSSYASPAEECERIIAAAEGSVRRPGTTVEISSFGFRYGVPQGDLVVDLRFIPNPYYVADLRPLCGKDKACADYVFSHASARDTLAGLVGLVSTMAAAYAEEGRPLLRVRIGCTGGWHRSVAMVEALGSELAGRGIRAVLRHREMK